MERGLRKVGTSGFRPEIAGLRAIAVVSVVLFHLKMTAFQGGFIGVDVFFVISGYLITRNILVDLDRQRFSFGQFYIRRMRRIFPALIFTVILTYVAGALWCSPLMFLDVAKEGTHALLWISNLQYWREAHQYFAHDSDDLALLHCWSLSLEEQFYLIWPLFMVAAHRYGKTFEAIAIAALASFLSSVIVTRTDPSATFFLTPFRIYEFGCGTLVLFLEKRLAVSGLAAEALSGIGVVAIIVSAMTFSPAMAHMDVAALLPCLGAAAVIWMGGRTGAARLITNPADAWPWRHLLFALPLPLADHLLCALHFCGRCRQRGRPSWPGRRDGPARDRHVLFRRAQVHPAT